MCRIHTIMAGEALTATDGHRILIIGSVITLPQIHAHVKVDTCPRLILHIIWTGDHLQERRHAAHFLRVVAYLEQKSDGEKWQVMYDVPNGIVWIEPSSDSVVEIDRAKKLIEEVAARVKSAQRSK